jgi:hypothetical protein
MTEARSLARQRIESMRDDIEPARRTYPRSLPWRHLRPWSETLRPSTAQSDFVREWRLAVALRGLHYVAVCAFVILLALHIVDGGDRPGGGYAARLER